QRGVGLQRRTEERLTGQETDHEIWSLLELLPVSLARQILQVRLHALRMGLEAQLLRRRIGNRTSIEEGIERGLGVHHNLASIRQLHRHIWAQQLVVLVACRYLLTEGAILHHARV